MKIRKEQDFISIFDELTGQYVRSGVMVDGKDSGRDPFMSSFPELLDIGIMGHCIHGKTGLCMAAGVECYQNGLHAINDNMKLEDFKKIAEQCEGKTFQFALGGCGDPDQHENFEDILKVCKEHGIVCNFTTSGLGMTEEIAKLCKKYCGAVAVSWYRSDYTLNAIKLLLQEGVKTNIHYVLSTDSIQEALDGLKNNLFPEDINAIVFLLHKPVGLGSAKKVIRIENKIFKEFVEYISNEELNYKIGFDSCTVPAFVNNPGKIDLDSLDTCEGARWSAYITADMKMLPCSFDNQEQRWSVDLNEFSIEEAWDSIQFEEFRSYLREACSSCVKRELCMGGCPIRPEIVLCEDRAQKNAGVYRKVRDRLEELGRAKCEGFEIGIEIGRAKREGIELGIKDGRTEEKLKNAKNLKMNGVDLKTIAVSLGLTQQEVMAI